MSPYLCLFYVGVFSLIIFLFGFIIYYSINNFDDFFANFRNESFISVIYLILFFIFSLFLNVMTFLIVYYFSPTLLMVTDIISPMLKWIFNVFEDKSAYGALDIILNIIGYSIVLFFSLIYNEIIICNFFGLNKSTKKFLDREQREELALIIDNKNDNDDDNDDNNNNDNFDEPIILKNEMDY